MRALSQSIVNFIARLSPLYTCQHADGHDCALSLLDGTLILPVDESHAPREEGWVEVFWQGDCRRRSEVPGRQLANVAVCRHLEMQGIGLPASQQALLRGSLADQFRQLTGQPLLPEKMRAVAS